MAVAGLVHRYLPQYQFISEDLRMFPKAVFKSGSVFLCKFELFSINDLPKAAVQLRDLGAWDWPTPYSAQELGFLRDRQKRIGY
jgi:hypothetical protein